MPYGQSLVQRCKCLSTMLARHEGSTPLVNPPEPILTQFYFRSSQPIFTPILTQFCSSQPIFAPILTQFYFRSSQPIFAPILTQFYFRSSQPIFTPILTQFYFRSSTYLHADPDPVLLPVLTTYLRTPYPVDLS